MQPEHILALAAWPPCPLHLPDQVEVGQWGVIFDVPLFISLHLARLDSESALLRKIAARNLAALARKLSQSLPQDEIEVPIQAHIRPRRTSNS